MARAVACEPTEFVNTRMTQIKIVLNDVTLAPVERKAAQVNKIAPRVAGKAR
jgi:hypothetical protein